jgi:AraC-like DNA-binding protein
MLRIRAAHLEADMADMKAVFGSTLDDLQLDFEDRKNGIFEATGAVLGTTGCTIASYEISQCDVVRPAGNILQFEMALSGAVIQRHQDEQLVSRYGTAFLSSPSAHDVIFRPQSEKVRSVGVTLPVSALDEYLALSGETRSAAKHITLEGNRIRPDAPLLDLARFLVGNLATYLPNPKIAERADALLFETFVELLRATGYVETYNEAGIRTGTRRDKAGAMLVRRAEEYMRAHFDEPLTIPLVARATGVSIRALQMAFREHREIAPRDALNQIRLQMARETLESADDRLSVTAAALDCGITHLGRFSQAYLKTYGEFPSDTLRRSLQRGRSNPRSHRPFDASSFFEIASGQPTGHFAAYAERSVPQSGPSRASR